MTVLDRAQSLNLRGRLERDADMSRYLTWRAGGRAKALYAAADLDDLCAFLRVLPEAEPVYFVGLGSNLLVRDGGEAACFLGDLVPTAAHLPPPWIMGYDLEPLVTLETKRALLSRAEADGWILVFEHDPTCALGRVVRDGKSFACAPLDTPSAQG